jgi:hypothetical protein
VTKAERERRAVAEHRCPLTWSCYAYPGEPCKRRIGIRQVVQVLKHPHPERVKLVKEG